MSQLLKLQVALVIRGFAIRGFDYSRISICGQNAVSAAFTLIIRGF